jgi:hypothetical protein
MVIGKTFRVLREKEIKQFRATRKPVLGMATRSIYSHRPFGNPAMFNRDRIRVYFHPFSVTGTPREDQIHEYHLILQ